MAGYNLGRIGLNYRGAYSASASYEKLDVVTYGGSSYIAKAAAQAKVPTNTSYWDVLAQGAVETYFYSTTVNKSVAASTFVTMISYTVPQSGTYMVDMTLAYAGNSSGRRCLLVNVNEVRDNSACVYTSPSGDGQTGVRSTALLQLTQGDQLVIQAYQTSGATLSTDAYIKVLQML